MDFEITPYQAVHRSQIIELSVRAWEPVFTALKPAVQDYVYDAFYPQGWQVRQVADVEKLLVSESENVWVAVREDTVLGWVGIRLHPIDTMGEIYILAVDPNHQQRGVGNSLMRHAMDLMRQAGMKIVMVETGDDPGHASARRSYEDAGFERWPVARYFRRL